MALADRMKAARRPGPPCSVAVALENLPPGELEVFVDLLGTPERRGKDARVIFELMQEERWDLLVKAREAAEAEDTATARELEWLAGVYDIAHQTINRHRGRQCRCAKDAA